jgi:hypothetical protein
VLRLLQRRRISVGVDLDQPAAAIGRGRRRDDGRHAERPEKLAFAGISVQVVHPDDEAATRREDPCRLRVGVDLVVLALVIDRSEARDQ